MQLHFRGLLLSASVASIAVESFAEGFRPWMGKTFSAQSRGRRRSPVAYIRGGAGRARRFRTGALKLGVGLLTLGSATILFCGSLSSGCARSGGESQARSWSSKSLPSILERDQLLHHPRIQKQHNQQHTQVEWTMLDHENDSYNGVIINEKGLPKDKDAFKRELESSLEAWRLEGRKGVWLKIPADRTELVPVSQELGFELHHAEKSYIMLNMWLPSTTNQLPPNASHQVGVGAMIVNDAGEMLVVREKNGPLRGTGIWKFPTGLIDAGEDIPHAAAREVFEETGLHAEFESVLAFRHGHRGLFGKSDLFFVVRMRVKPGTDANNLRAQASEIEACQWMPLSSFIEQNRNGGSVLLRELSPIMEAHFALEAERAAGSKSAGCDGALVGEEGENDGAPDIDGDCRPSGATFIPRTIESKHHGRSKLYYGKL